MRAGRSKLARLATLEAAERARVAEVEMVIEDTTARVVTQLTAADRAAIFEHLDAQEAGGPYWADICRASAALEGLLLEDPAIEAARAWGRALEDTPEGLPYPLPPAGAAAYFEREAARCDTVKEEAPGEVLPAGVSLEAVQTAARWSAAWWRYEAAFALELGEA